MQARGGASSRPPTTSRRPSPYDISPHRRCSAGGIREQCEQRRSWSRRGEEGRRSAQRDRRAGEATGTVRARSVQAPVPRGGVRGARRHTVDGFRGGPSAMRSASAGGGTRRSGMPSADARGGRREESPGGRRAQEARQATCGPRTREESPGGQRGEAGDMPVRGRGRHSWAGAAQAVGATRIRVGRWSVGAGGRWCQGWRWGNRAWGSAGRQGGGRGRVRRRRGRWLRRGTWRRRGRGRPPRARRRPR